jgi:hypothetical protein
MKTILLLVLLCTVEPPTNFNGVYYGQQNNRVVNLGWNSSYVGANYEIKRNGITVASGVNQPVNIVSVAVEPSFKSATFTIRQNVDGVWSREVSTTVRKVTKNPQS